MEQRVLPNDVMAGMTTQGKFGKIAFIKTAFYQIVVGKYHIHHINFEKQNT